MKKEFKLSTGKEYIELEKPKEKLKDCEYLDMTNKINVKFSPTKQLWVVETKELSIIKSLIERFGGDIPIVEIINKYNKDKLVLR